ncbi:MAG: DUF1134 domain-containing protein [Nevskia sp.]|nr:DUF1134 domain-containing protein [Nevskia sp.]
MRDSAQQYRLRLPRKFLPVLAAALATVLLSVTGVSAVSAQPAPVPQNDQNNPSPGPSNSGEQSGPNQANGTVKVGPETYSKEETMAAAEKFFGGTTQGLAKVIEKAFSDNGRPNAYIVGNEGSGAVIVGLRYGEGTLYYKGGGSMKVYWQGPSVGWDLGGNAAKVFTLVYNLHWTKDLFQRFPGVDGSLYFVAGVGLNYQRASDITLAPIRTGVGLRAGANVGYLSYTRRKTWNPF